MSFFSTREIYSLQLRLNTARGSGTGLVTVGSAKVKACKSIIFTEGIPEVKITVQFSEGKIKRSLVNFDGLEKTVTEMVTGCLRTMKVGMFALGDCKVILVSFEKIQDSVYVYDNSKNQFS